MVREVLAAQALPAAFALGGALLVGRAGVGQLERVDVPFELEIFGDDVQLIEMQSARPAHVNDPLRPRCGFTATLAKPAHRVTRWCCSRTDRAQECGPLGVTEAQLWAGVTKLAVTHLHGVVEARTSTQDEFDAL